MTPIGSIRKEGGVSPYLMKTGKPNVKISKTQAPRSQTPPTLKEFIETVLDEEEGDGGGDYGIGGDYGVGGGGGGYGGGQDALYQTFLKPFVDVGKTAAYGVERLSANVQTVLKGILVGIPTLIIPFLEYDYKTFREEEKENVEKIKKKYEKVLQSNIEAITTNDAFGLAFLLYPGLTLGAQLALKTPEAAMHILEVLLGGSEVLKSIALALKVNLGLQAPPPDPHGGWQVPVGHSDSSDLGAH